MRAGNDPASGLFGRKSKLADIFPDTVDPIHPIGLTSEREHGGRGDAARDEEIKLRVAYGGRGQITAVQRHAMARRRETSCCRIAGAGSNGARPGD
jgi:hypothetical protein